MRIVLSAIDRTSGERLDLGQVLGQLCIASFAVEAVVNLAMAGRADRTDESGVVQPPI